MKLIVDSKFDSAHRLSNYIGKCARIHGHSYHLRIELAGEELNEWGALIDFADIKKIIKEKIDDIYDHRLMLMEGDKLNEKIAKVIPKDHILWFRENTTAENISRRIMQELSNILPKDITVTSVTVWETEGCGAECTDDNY